MSDEWLVVSTFLIPLLLMIGVDRLAVVSLFDFGSVPEGMERASPP